MSSIFCPSWLFLFVILPHSAFSSKFYALTFFTVGIFVLQCFVGELRGAQGTDLGWGLAKKKVSGANAQTSFYLSKDVWILQGSVKMGDCRRGRLQHILFG